VVDGARRDSSYHDVSRDDSKSVAIGTFTPRAPGQLEIVAEVDPDRDITESSESNNTARTTIDVEERLRELPDLAVTSLTTDPSPPIVGQQLQVDASSSTSRQFPRRTSGSTSSSTGPESTVRITTCLVATRRLFRSDRSNLIRQVRSRSKRRSTQQRRGGSHDEQQCCHPFGHRRRR